MRSPLSAAFLAAAQAADPPRDALEQELRRIWQQATATWPHIGTSARRFMRHLAERAPAGAALPSVLSSLYASDLYLACGCVCGDPGAIEALELGYVAQVPAFLARGNAAADLVDEVKQRLRMRLLTAEAGKEPRLATYSGRGPLHGWVRLTTVRIAIDLDRERGSRAARGFEAEALEPATADPELIMLKNQYGTVVRQAIESTLANLPARDASLLRLFFLEQVTHDALALMYHAPKIRIRRWLDDIRDKIAHETRRYLANAVAVPESQIDSVLRLFSHDLDPSIIRFLKQP